MYESLTVVSTSFWSTEKSVNMGTVLHDCLAHFSSKYMLKEEQRQAVLRLLEKKRCCGGSIHGFWEKLNLPIVRGSQTRTKSKRTWYVLRRHYDVSSMIKWEE